MPDQPRARPFLASIGLTGCVQPHSTDCVAPYDADCPLFQAIEAHEFALHDGWLARCQRDTCLTHYASLRAKAREGRAGAEEIGKPRSSGPPYNDEGVPI